VRRRIHLLLVLSTLTLAGSAAAGNTRSFLFGNEAAVTAGAGPALYTGSDALWYNPAGLGGFGRNRLSITGTAFMARYNPLRNLAVSDLSSGPQSSTLMANQFLSIPTALVQIFRGNDRMSWGFGIFVPKSTIYHARSSLASSENIFGMIGADYHRGLDISLQNFQYDIGPALGWQITPRLRMGFSLMFVYEALKRSTTVFVRSAGQLDGASVTAFGYSTSRFDVSYYGLKAVVGLQWELARGWHAGIVVRSPTLAFYRWGEKSSSVSQHALDGDFTSPAEFTFDSHSLEHWGADLVEPLEISIALGHSRPGGWIGLEGSIMLPTASKAFQIRRQMEWNISLGGRLELTDAVGVGAGLFTDRSPNTSPSALGAQDVDFYGATVGVEWSKTLPLRGKPDSESLVFSTTLALRTALGIGSVGGLQYNPDDGGVLETPPRDARFLELSLHLGSSISY